MKKILVIDDDASECKRLEVFIEEKGFQPLLAMSGAEGLQKAESQAPEIVLLDITGYGWHNPSREDQKSPERLLRDHGYSSPRYAVHRQSDADWGL
jgi:ActR/RegA family two-component response regulator